MSHFSYSLKSSEVTSRACLFTPHLPGTLSSALRLPLARGGLGRRKGSGSSGAVSFTDPPRQPSPAASPRNSLLAAAGRGPETFPASLPFGVCPHLPPSLPLTNSHGAGAGPVPHSGNSNPRRLPGDSARGNLRGSQGTPSAPEGIPSSPRPRSLEHLVF